MTPPVIHPARALLLLGAVSLLAGCMYDPYTGTYSPCCGNPYSYYGYPAYAPPYGYPSSYPPPYYPPSGYATQPYGYAPPASAASNDPAETALAHRFVSANATHDGRLTLQQAQAANWQVVAGNFPEIDVERKGYVTLNEIRVWLETRSSQPTGTRG